MRRWVLIGISLVVSGVFLWLALRGVPLDEVAANIRQANFFWIVVSFLTIGGALWTRGVRWSGLVGNRVSVTQGFYIFSVAMLFNQLPLRAGEVVRTLLATRYGVPVVTGAASIIIERLIDVLTVVLLIVFGLTRIPTAPPALTNAATFFGVAATVGFIVLILLARFPNLAHNLLIKLENWIPVLARLGLRKRLEEVLDGLRPFTHWRSALHVIFWTIIAWGLSLFTLVTLGWAFDVQGIDLWLLSALSVSMAALGVAIPVTVAGIGPFQGAVRLGGEILGMNAVLAATLGIVFHGVTLLGYAVFGVIGLLGLGMSLSDLMKRADIEEKPVPGEVMGD
jgi:uncharacterized membrane protein YbhN (UPF0104 family)